MTLIKALILSLGKIISPVTTKYQIGFTAHNLYHTKTYKGKTLGITDEHLTRSRLNYYLNKLLDDGIITQHEAFHENVYVLLGKSDDSAEEIACTVDPFSYVSHLSAMSYHGLTNRIPSKLFISSPDRKKWNEYAQDRMERDIEGDLELYLSRRLPQLSLIPMTKIRQREVVRSSSLHLGAYKNVHGRTLRVSTLGRTFLDMLKKPNLCGGMYHVLETYDEHAEIYLRLITDEIERHGRPIDKVRAGYILDERLGLGNDVIESWTQFAQRGGSRKLDGSNEFVPRWSDKWCLSLNLFE